jgi:hypothetical protein
MRFPLLDHFAGHLDVRIRHRFPSVDRHLFGRPAFPCCQSDAESLTSHPRRGRQCASTSAKCADVIPMLLDTFAPIAGTQGRPNKGRNNS